MFAAPHMLVPQDEIMKYNRRHAPSPTPPPANAPVPPPPPPANCPLPPPPPPTKNTGNNSSRIVPGLKDALHEAKKRINGEEETPACAEGISTGDPSNYTPSQVSNSDRPKSWHGGPQVPGKPARNMAIIGEMQAKLKARKAKIDRESAEPESAPTYNQLPPQSPALRKNSTPPSSSRNSTPSESRTLPHRNSWTPPCDWGPNKAVVVDQERKEELMLAKQVRQGSVKFLQRNTPSPFTQIEQYNNTPQEVQRTKFQKEVTPVTPFTAPSPSPIVQRYWNQCQGNTEQNLNSSNSNDDNDLNTGQSDEAVPPWKLEEFPDIKSKIKIMEEESKPTFKVPDIRANLIDTNAHPKGWVETKKKLQTQLDHLLTRTTQKMSIFGAHPDSLHKSEDNVENGEEGEKIRSARNSPAKTMMNMNGQIKSIIQSVANEIQRSFSQHELSKAHEQNDKEECHENNAEHFECHIPSVEDPVDFDSEIKLLDISAARDKGKIIRKCSSGERRLPASVLAKRKAAEKLKQLLQANAELSEAISENNEAVTEAESSKECISEDVETTTTEEEVKEVSIEKIDELKVEDVSSAALKRVGTPVKIGTPERVSSPDIRLIEKQPINVLNVEHMSDEKLANTLAKQISKMQSDYVVRLLKSIETGVLECSIPLLLPFLSLQVRMSMGKHIFKELDKDHKSELVKDGFVNNLIDDISDIAVLQEVIDKSQDKVDYLQFVENAYSGGKNKNKKKDCGVQTDIKPKEIEKKDKIDKIGSVTVAAASTKKEPSSSQKDKNLNKTQKKQDSIKPVLKEEKNEDKVQTTQSIEEVKPVVSECDKNNNKYKSIFDDGSDDELERMIIRIKEEKIEEESVKETEKESVTKSEIDKIPEEDAESTNSRNSVESSEIKSETEKSSDDDGQSINSRTSIDEGFAQSEEDLTNSDEDVQQKNKEEVKNVEKKDIPPVKKDNSRKSIESSEKSDEDEGIGAETKEKPKEKAKIHEKGGKQELKSTIMNILNNAKSSQPRPERNFGRNFEVPTKMPVLKPVIPNDRRNAKAKKLDSMWSQVTGVQQQMNYQSINNAATKPVTRVPWTKRKNGLLPAEAEKLKNDKEIEDYKKCQEKLKSVTIPKSKTTDSKKEEVSAKTSLQSSKTANNIKEEKTNEEDTSIKKENHSITKAEERGEKTLEIKNVDIEAVPIEEVKPSEDESDESVTTCGGGKNEKEDAEEDLISTSQNKTKNTNKEIRKDIPETSNEEKTNTDIKQSEPEVAKVVTGTSDSKSDVAKPDVAGNKKEEKISVVDKPESENNQKSDTEDELEVSSDIAESDLTDDDMEENKPLVKEPSKTTTKPTVTLLGTTVHKAEAPLRNTIKPTATDASTVQRIEWQSRNTTKPTVTLLGASVQKAETPSRNATIAPVAVEPIAQRSRVLEPPPGVPTFTMRPPPPKGRPPPPPSMKPPPLPMSPPPQKIILSLPRPTTPVNLTNQTSAKNEDHDSENEEIEDDESEYSIEYEEVSEWETDSEDELEEDCKVEKEAWNNILSSSKGPCTYTGSFSVKK